MPYNYFHTYPIAIMLCNIANTIWAYIRAYVDVMMSSLGTSFLHPTEFETFMQLPDLSWKQNGLEECVEHLEGQSKDHRELEAISN